MRYLVGILLCVIVFSCNKVKKPAKPENLISKDKMVAILVDLTIYNSAKGSNKRLIDNNGVSIDSYIYKKHNIDSIQFKESNDYYTYDVKTYTSIYEKVEDSLTKLKEKYTEERDEKTGRKQMIDSIKRENKRKKKPEKLNDSIISKKLKSKNLPEVF